jgi:hypothetical protein
VGRVLWSLLCATHPSRHYEEQASRVHGSVARQSISVCLLQEVQSPRTVCSRVGWHRRKEEAPFQECLALNTDWTFLELVSNTIIADDVICAHWESKKKKALAALFGSAPHKYRMVCAPHHHPPQHHHHQLATCPPPHQNIMPRAMAPPPTMLHPPSQKRGIVPRTCHNCGQVGYFVKECMTPRWIDAP